MAVVGWLFSGQESHPIHHGCQIMIDIKEFDVEALVNPP